MAQIPHVQPGDIISSELINAIIDALGGLDKKITECCEEHAKEPQPEEPRGKIFIDDVVPDKAAYGDFIDIVGGGFIPDKRGNEVTIGGEKVLKFGNVTETLIEAMVPVLKYKKLTLTSVVVENTRNGRAKHRLSAGPEKTPDVVWVPTDEKVVEEMLNLAKVDKGDKLYDLGSGDGRIVVKAAAAPFHAMAIGIELDENLILKANDLAKTRDVVKRVEFRKGNLFEADFADATVVTLYLTDELNLRLRPKLQKLAVGTRIVSHTYKMGDWKHVGHSNKNNKDVYLWVVGQ